MDNSKSENVYADAVAKGKKMLQAKNCFAPTGDCEGKIISAHTISKCHGLREIATQGQVYQVHADSWSSSYEELMKMRTRGVSQASTFNGFCEKHDAELFSAVENHPFTGTAEQVFLLMYRTICKELFLKRTQMRQSEQLRFIEAAKVGASPDEMSPTALGNLYEAGVELGVDDLLKDKAKMDQWLLSKEFGHIEACIIRCGTKPDLVCSGYYAPHFDFCGNQLQQDFMATNQLNHIYCNVMALSRGGWIVLAYFKGEGDGPRELINTLIQTRQPDAATAWLTFVHFENAAYRIGWWDALPSDLQKRALWTCRDVMNPFSTVENQIHKMLFTGYVNWEPGKPRWVNR